MSQKVTINSVDEIPRGMTEEEEHRFWESHEIGESLLRSVAENDPRFPPSQSRTSSRSIAIRLHDDTIRRLKRIADSRGMGYQTLMKAFVLERLYEEEKRAGLFDEAITTLATRRAHGARGTAPAQPSPSR
jgi:predicted transcriptional regulator